LFDEYQIGDKLQHLR